MSQNKNLKLGSHDIAINDITPYLLSNKWIKEEKDTNLVFIAPYSDDNDNPILLVLPKDMDYYDTPLRIKEALTQLSILENKPISDLIYEIKLGNTDIFYFRVKFPSSSSSFLSLEKAINYLNQLKRLFTYTASVESEPVKQFHRVKNIGKDYANRCNFGHTFEGSFGFSVISPIPPKSETLNHKHNSESPFERRVVERLVWGLKNAQDSVLKKDPSDIVNNYQKGFNANICEVVQDLIKIIDNFETECSVSWSPIYPIKEELSNIVVNLNHNFVPYLEVSANMMRNIQEIKEAIVIGHVTQLRSDDTNLDEREDDDFIREIVVREEMGRNIHISLDLENYKKACDVHKNRLIVCFKGKIEKRHNLWNLLNPENISWDFKEEI